MIRNLAGLRLINDRNILGGLIYKEPVKRPE